MRTLFLSLLLVLVGAIGAQAAVSTTVNRPAAVAAWAANYHPNAVSFSLPLTGVQTDSSWRRVRPPNRLHINRDRLDIRTSDPDVYVVRDADGNIVYYRHPYHRHFRRFYTDGYWDNGIWYPNYPPAE